MKKVISALVAFVAISASASTYVTVTDCNQGEGGNQCRKITYKVRPASPASAQAEVELYPIGEGTYGPAPKVTGGFLLRLLQNLGTKQSAADQKAQEQREIDQYMKAGG